MKLSILLSLLMFSGCVTRRACERKFPTIEKDSVRESIRTVTTYRDTTVYVYLPGDTVYKETPVRPGEISSLCTQWAISEAWINNGKLMHGLVQKDTSMPATVKNAVKTTVTNKEKERVVYQVREVNEVSEWRKVEMWVGRVAVIFIILFILERLAIVSIR